MTIAMNRSMTGLEWAILLILSILWGGSFFFVEIALTELPPFTIVVMRVGLAALALLFVVYFLRLSIPKDRKVWAAFFVMGVLNNVLPFTLIAWGQIHIASGLASILNATTPLFTVLIAHFLTRDEPMTVRRLIGVIVGFLGVGVMFTPDVMRGLNSNLIAQLAVLSAALLYAFGGIYGRVFQRMKVNPIITATGQLTASTLLLIPVWLIVDHPWTLSSPEWQTWWAVAALAVLSTSLAYIFYFRVLATAGATNLLLVTFLIPVSAIILGVTVLGEQLKSEHIAGMVFIGIGLAIIDGRAIASLGRYPTS